MALAANVSNRVQEALTRQAKRAAKRIEITVQGGVVTRRGHVHSWAQKNAAEGATLSAPSVGRVNNELTIAA